MGTVSRAESTFTIIMGAPNHILISTRLTKASVPLVRNWGAASQIPSFTRIFGRKPYTPLRIHFQENAMTMEGKAQGMINSVL